MTIARRLTMGAAAALLGTTGTLAATLLTAGPANAAVDPSTCTFSFNLSVNRVAATCFNPVASEWYLRVECDKFDGRVVYVNGSPVYTAGTSTSIAGCPYNSELGRETIVNL